MNRLIAGHGDKLSLLLELLEDDYARGVTVIDPTGELARAAGNRIPPRLVKQTIYFNPADIGHPLPFNVLSDITDTHAFVEHFLAMFAVIYPEGSNTLTRLYADDILLVALKRLLAEEGQTLLGVQQLLKDMTFRKQFPDDYKPGFAFLNAKFNLIFSNPTTRNLVGQRGCFDAPIIMANLDRRALGDLTARFLGHLLLARSQGTVYIHDLPFFARKSDGLASLLPQDRFTVSINSLRQVSDAMQDGLLGIGGPYIFRTNSSDAENYALGLGLLNPRALTELDYYEYRTAQGLFKTEPPPSRKRLHALKKRTRSQTLPKRKVEKLVERYLESS